MRGDLKPEHREFGRVVREALDMHAGPAEVRAIWDDPDHGQKGWGVLADLGVFAVLVPEALGGAGGDPIDLVLPLEEVGRHALPLPVIETVTATLALASAPEGLGERWLPGVAEGRTRWSMVGVSGLAPYGLRSDATLRVTGDEVTVFRAEQVAWTPVDSTDPGLDLARWEGGAAGMSLAVPGDLVRTTASWVSALVLVGLADRMIEMTRDHTLERQQFGRPIAEFQALKHRLADAAVAVEAARGLAWFAAYAARHRPAELQQAARFAKGSAGEAARIAGTAALQLHGGIGFTWEHDLHLYLHRARSLESWFGSSADHRIAAGRAVLDSLEQGATRV